MKWLRKFKAYLLNMNFPHMVRPCAHCGRTAGFWVMRRDNETVRRAWCLNCLSDPDLDIESMNVTSFEGYAFRR